MPTWPSWWAWEIELTPHVEARMEDRRFTEVDLRAMLHGATGFARDHVEGRWAIRTIHGGRRWEVIVEPDLPARRLLVVTAYPVGGDA